MNHLASKFIQYIDLSNIQWKNSDSYERESRRICAILELDSFPEITGWDNAS